MGPRWGSTPRLTDWLTVSRNVPFTLTEIREIEIKNENENENENENGASPRRSRKKGAAEE
jgi:hypothetical protein